MKFLELRPGYEASINLYWEDGIKITAKFLRNLSNERKIDTIEIEYRNSDISKNSFVFENANICQNIIDGIDISVLEINLRESSKPESKASFKLAPKDLIINKGTFIYNALLTYEKGEANVPCKFSDFTSQPKHKNGNIIIGNP